MNLYLIRHAHALPLDSADVADDAGRPLSDVGRQQAAQLAAAFRRLSLPIDLLLSSPLLRARQTADELARQWQGRLEVRTLNDLAPGGSCKRLARFLCKQEANHIALVGHEPDLGRHTRWLIGGKRAQIAFTKAAVACLACDDPPDKAAAVLLWLVTPQWYSR